MELIAKFDPFLKEHLNNYGNKGSGKSNYISSHIIRELISLMADKVLIVIVEEIKNAKYFGLIVDSTPDVTHIDQLAIVLRYVKSDGQVIERFIKCIDIYSHNAEYFTSTVIETIKQLGLNIENSVGQSYDNASNMAGKYTGLQARIKKKAPAAEYLPCAAHSLNLVGVRAVESCNNAVKYFSIIQTLYNFFSISTHRWDGLNQSLKSKGMLFLKPSSQTRWSANANATKALTLGYSEISKILFEMSNDMNENTNTRNEARNILNQLRTREMAIMIVTWNCILQRINLTSKTIQSSTTNISIIVPSYNSLFDFIQNVRENFEIYEN